MVHFFLVDRSFGWICRYYSAICILAGFAAGARSSREATGQIETVYSKMKQKCQVPGAGRIGDRASYEFKATMINSVIRA
jgi:hypothetical protein